MFINNDMALILCEFISLTFKRWFTTYRVYLRLELYTDGTWHLNACNNYQRESITKRDWKRIRKQCKVEIIKAQKDHIVRYFNKTEVMRRVKYNYKKVITVRLIDCIKIIENNYKVLFEDKI